jgi:hypothetical protein
VDLERAISAAPTYRTSDHGRARYSYWPCPQVWLDLSEPGVRDKACGVCTPSSPVSSCQSVVGTSMLASMPELKGLIHLRMFQTPL